MKPLLKIAQQRDDDEGEDGRQQALQRRRNFHAAGAIGAAIYVPRNVRNLVWSEASRELNKRVGSQAQADELIKRSPGVRVVDVSHSPHSEIGPHYSARGRLLKTPPSLLNPDPQLDEYKGPYVAHDTNRLNIGILAHELGHARKTNNPLIEARIQRRPGVLSGVLDGAGKMGKPVAALSMASALSKNKHVRRAGLLAPLLFAAPTLAEEGRANINAWKELKHVASGNELRQARRALLASYSGYLAPTAATMASTYAIGKIMQRRRREEEERKRREREEAEGQTH